jgi:predicted nucleic acid-binding protein
MRLVLDAATMVAGIRSDRGASRRLLRMALEGRGFRLLISVPLLIEYEAVLTRPEHLKVARLTIDDIGVLLPDAVAAVAERVELAFLWRPMLPDADDDMVLETAINGRADGIVTFNRRDFEAAEERFGIAVLSARDAVRRLERKE